MNKYYLNGNTAKFLLFTFLAAAFLLTCFSAMRHATPAYDEGPHLKYGFRILEGNSDRFDDSKMPVTALNALSFKKTKSLFAAHVPTVIFSLIGAFVVFLWSRELYGFGAGLFSMALYVFEPNILAHSQFVGTDAYCWVAAITATYLFWRFLKYGGVGRGVLAALVLALAQLTKYTCIYLFPIFLFLALGKAIAQRRIGRHAAASFTAWSAMFLLTSVLVINAGFFFNGTMTPLKDYDFKSTAMKDARDKLSFAAEWPVPLPYPYVQGIDLVREVEETGGGNGNNYLMGKFKEKGQGFAGYYFMAFLFKAPLALQVLFVWSLLLLLKRRNKQFWENEFFIVTPIAFFAVYFNFFVITQIGLRYSMIGFPFLFVLCGYLWSEMRSGVKKKAVILALVAYQAASAYSYYPHFLSYFNELVADRKTAYKVLADSNIDWGHNLHYLKEYVAKHPQSRLAGPEPRPGHLIVTANQLIGIKNPERFRWLRENFEPTRHVAYSYLVYDISVEDARRLLQQS